MIELKQPGIPQYRTGSYRILYEDVFTDIMVSNGDRENDYQTALITMKISGKNVIQVMCNQDTYDALVHAQNDDDMLPIANKAITDLLSHTTLIRLMTEAYHIGATRSNEILRGDFRKLLGI